MSSRGRSLPEWLVNPQAFWCLLKAASQFWPEAWRKPPALKYLLAIGYQESRFRTRVQVNGPALSYWQLEPSTVLSVLDHPLVGGEVAIIRMRLGIPPLHQLQLATSDLWAASIARALLRTDPFPLIDEPEEAWLIYLRVWRPGKPRRETWDEAWTFAKTTEALADFRS